jgi:hypothetical protein
MVLFRKLFKYRLNEYDDYERTGLWPRPRIRLGNTATTMEKPKLPKLTLFQPSNLDYGGFKSSALYTDQFSHLTRYLSILD